MDYKNKYLKYKNKYLNSKKILLAGSSNESNDLSVKDCLFIAQGNRGFCWLATSILVLYKLLEQGVELNEELEDFVDDTLIKFDSPEKFNNSCPIIPKRLGLTDKIKEKNVFTEELEFIKGAYVDINFNDPNIFKKLHPDNKFVKKEELDKNLWVPPEIKELYFKKEFNELTIDEKAKLNLIFSNNLRSVNNLKVKIIKDNGSITDPSKLELLELISKINYDSDDEGDVILNQNTVQKITLKSLADQLDANFDYYDINADYLIILTKGIDKNEFAVLNFKLTKKYNNDGFNDTLFIKTVLEKSGINLDNRISFIIESIDDLYKQRKDIYNVKNFNIEMFNNFNKFNDELLLKLGKYNMASDLFFNISDHVENQKNKANKVFTYDIILRGSFYETEIRKRKIRLLDIVEKFLKKDRAVGTISLEHISSKSGHAMAFYYCEEKEKVVYCEPNRDNSLELINFMNSPFMNDQWIISGIDVYFLIDQLEIDLLLKIN